MPEQKKGLYQYKVFYTDGTHSYLYFYERLDDNFLNDLKKGFLQDDMVEFVNLDKCKAIRLMHNPEVVTNE